MDQMAQKQNIIALNVCLSPQLFFFQDYRPRITRNTNLKDLSPQRLAGAVKPLSTLSLHSKTS
jgi:hypothetical protein